MTPGVRLLGSPSIRDGEVWRDVPLDKRLALLTHLACAESWVSRERLSYLFWPDNSSARARINLRQLLARTKSLPFTLAIDADDKRLRWDVDSDVKAFRRAVRDADWPTALEQYRGELAGGLVTDDVSEYANWLEFERSQLREAHRQAALQQAGVAMAAGRHQEAAALYELLLEQDPLDEGAMQSLLRLLVQLGAGEEARRRLEAFGLRLHAELGFAPSAATELVVTAGSAQQAPAAEPTVQSLAAGTVGRTRLTAPLTSFVGREKELAETILRLSSESCRLLTLLGPGGVGKTRLALRAAQELESRFRHGAIAVPLAQVPNAEALPLALAAALGLEIRWLRTPLDQLIDYLAPRELLLVLDNFEHLSDGAMLLQQLLSECPMLKVLVTSRQRLRLQGEWLLPLAGLEVPPQPSVRDFSAKAIQEALACDALALLDERARQVEPGFTITSMSLPAAVDICRLLEGLPLGIELAAGWLRVLSLVEVRSTLEKSLDELESDAQDAIERHRSLRAAIDHSWNLLTPAEQQAGRSLAVFHGGCDRAAARAVTGTTLPLLKTLTEKSLLRLGEGGRYDTHPLIHRYLQDRLAERPDEGSRLTDAHANYYVHLLGSWAGRLHGPQQPAMLVQFAPDYDNITAAWLTALDRGWIARCLVSIEPLVLFHGIQGRFTEGERLFAAGLARFAPHVAALERGNLLFALLTVDQAWFMSGLGRFDEAAASALHSLDLVAHESYPSVEFRANQVLGSIASRRGDRSSAREFLNKGLVVAEATGDQWALSLVLGQLGLLALRSEHDTEAKGHFERALAINEALGNTPGIVNDLDYLGQLSLATGDLAAAAASFERGLSLAEDSRFRLRLPYLKTQLATVKLALGQNVAAASLAQDALDVAEELGQRPLQAEALALLGRALTDAAEKSRCFTKALALAHALGEAPRTLDVLLDLAQLPAQRVEARELVRLVAAHPAARTAQRDKAAALLHVAGSDDTLPDGPLLALDDAVRQLLA